MLFHALGILLPAKCDSRARIDTQRLSPGSPCKGHRKALPCVHFGTVIGWGSWGAVPSLEATEGGQYPNQATRPEGGCLQRALCPLWDCCLSPQDPGLEVMPLTSGHMECVKCWSPLPPGLGQGYHQPQHVAV